jgi:uncharacterized Zn finger protein (UPF0148 family)
MLVLKGCPRCGGDLSSGFDDEVSCIQCGYEGTLASRPAEGRSRLVPQALVFRPALAATAADQPRAA